MGLPAQRDAITILTDAIRSFSMIPAVSTIPLQQLASGDRLSLQVYKESRRSTGQKGLPAI
jgi:hypothetical protein